MSCIRVNVWTWKPLHFYKIFKNKISFFKRFRCFSGLKFMALLKHSVLIVNCSFELKSRPISLLNSKQWYYIQNKAKRLFFLLSNYFYKKKYFVFNGKFYIFIAKYFAVVSCMTDYLPTFKDSVFGCLT